MAAYYNEIEPFAAAWLRELMKAGHIMDGTVDERSIREVQPADLSGFTRCHFFAGIGVWDYALTRAGWGPGPVWTGSCPCQPFSIAGKGAGISDERHLWPELYRLIRECRPDAVFGEQVAAPAGLAWLDAVSADLEAAGYAIGAADLCAAGVGAPHIRQRLYFVAEPKGAGRRSDPGPVRGGQAAGIRAPEGQDQRGAVVEAGRASDRGSALGLGDANIDRARRDGRPVCHSLDREDWQHDAHDARASGADGIVGNACGEGLQERERVGGVHAGALGASQGEGAERASFWADADWIACADGKTRPVEPGSFPLAHGAPARVGRLRGYGNAIVAPVAQAFIEAYLDVRGAA